MWQNENLTKSPFLLRVFPNRIYENDREPLRMMAHCIAEEMSQERTSAQYRLFGINEADRGSKGHHWHANESFTSSFTVLGSAARVVGCSEGVAIMVMG